VRASGLCALGAQVGSGQRDVLGAAQTGSGKTLAFGLPIVDWLLRNRADACTAAAAADDDDDAHEDGEAGEAGAGGAVARKASGQLAALILTPTRELAVQVASSRAHNQ